MSVAENLPAGSQITKVVAHDDDLSDDNGRVRYRLVRQNDPQPRQHLSSYPDLVSVDAETGNVTLNGPLSWDKHNG